MFLDYVEDMANDYIPVTMNKWIEETDNLLKFRKKEILEDSGNISHKTAANKSNEEYEKYRTKQDKSYISSMDELQQVHLNDIGTIDNIKKIANELNYSITELSLDYQFRCNGSNEYLSFVDYILGIDDTFKSNSINYDFKLIDNPNELFQIIKEKNKQYPSRLLAGYCWNWNKKK